VPFNLTSSYGVAVTSGGGYLWLSTPSGVWRGSLSPTPLELTQDVVELDVREAPGKGEATLLLRNDDGRYNDPASPIGKGSQVEISPGYHTPAGPEVSQGPAFWIKGWEHRCREGSSLFVLHLGDAWWLLEGWRARRQYTWEADQASVKEILTFILSRAGLELSVLSSSDALNTLKPAFTIHPGENGAEAVRRLLAGLPDLLFFRGPVACIKNPQSTDAADYSYGDDHPILEGRYSSLASPFNRIQAFGSGVLGEAFAWEEVEELYDRLLQVHDINLDTQGKADERSQALLYQGQRAALAGEIVVPVNCGQELYDVVELTDGRAGLNAQRRRVIGLNLRYSAGRRPRYLHSLGLGGV
jgi:hypothetical protein